MEDKRCLFLKEEIIEDEVDPMGNSQNNCAKNFMSTEEGLVVLSLVRELLEYIGLEFTSGAFDAEIEAYKSYEYVGRERLALDLNLDAEKKGPLISQVLQVSKVMSSTESHEETRFSEANIKIECVDECENAINRHSPKFQEVVLKPECNPEELDLKPECSPDEMGQLDLRQVESSAVADSDEGVSQDPLSTEDISLQDRPTTTRSNCYKKQKTTCNWPEPFPSFGNLVQPSTSHGLPSDESNIEVIKRESISLEDSPSTSGPVIDLSSDMAAKRKKTVVTMQEKLSALKRMDSGVTAMKIAQEMGVGTSTVSDWKKDRDKIEKWCSQTSTTGTKKLKMMKKVPNNQVNECLYRWCTKRRKQGLPISGPLLKEKALHFNKEINGGKDFKASEGWLDSWKIRYGVRMPKKSGEKLPAKSEDVEELKKSLHSVSD